MPDSTALLIDFDGVLRHWPPNDESIERASGLPSGTIRRPANLRALLTAPYVPGLDRVAMA